MPLQFAQHAAEAYRFPLTIRHLLDSVLSTSADQQIVYRDQSAYTYREFVGRVGRLASMLARLGVSQGDTVAMMDWDSHRYLEAFFAVPMMGAVLQTVNVRMTSPQIAYTLQRTRASALIVHRDFHELAGAILPLLPEVRTVVTIDDGASTDVPDWAQGEYEELSASADPAFAFEDFDENALATTFFTTGTTGNPKGVHFTHRQLVLQALSATGPFGSTRHGHAFGHGDVYMPLTPMFHVHAWGMPYVATMLGLKQVYPGRLDPDLVCRLRRDHGVTFSHCVPTIVQMIMQAADAAGIDLSGWTMIIGGASLSRALYEEGHRRGMSLFSSFGMSETGPLVAVARPRLTSLGNGEAVAGDLTAAGVPAPLVSARVVDDAMNDVPRDGTTRGELVLRSPWLTSCYVGDPVASDALWRGGWLHTQDIATLDADGYITIRDRLKDVIKTGGEWLDSIHLEQLVATAEGVAEAAVIAAPDERWGERPLAVVVARPGSAVTLEAINAPIELAIEQGAMSRYGRIERFESVKRLPRTSVGKIDKKELRALFAGAARPALPPP